MNKKTTFLLSIICIFLMQGQIHADFYSNKILSLSPTAYWRLNESSGTTATDSSGNGNNGTYISTASGLYDVSISL